MYRCFILLFIFYIMQPIIAAQTIDALIIAYDMGDLNGLKPVADKLTAEGHKVVLLGFGTAGKNLPQSSGDYAREALLPHDKLQEITATYKPRVVLTGMASALQAQLLNAYAGQAKTVAFYDNCENPASKDYIQPFMKTVELKSLAAFYLPAEITRTFFTKFLGKTQIPLVVTGNPALSSWDQTFNTTDAKELRQQLHIPDDHRVIVFAGGYDETYPQYFKTFVDGVRNLPKTTVLVTYHPKTDGSLEHSAKAPNLRVIENKDFSTPTLCVVADMVACHKSSVGLQALYKGKPVLFVTDPAKDRNFLVTQKLALAAGSSAGVKDITQRIFANANRPSLEKIGLPTNATERMTQELKQWF